PLDAANQRIKKDFVRKSRIGMAVRRPEYTRLANATFSDKVFLDTLVRGIQWAAEKGKPAESNEKAEPAAVSAK
ncbi:MAG: hypothetical protein AAF497_12780, partial [Planctomycetota bacterium]